MKNILTKEDLALFAAWLRREGKSVGTVENYLRDAARFVTYLEAKGEAQNGGPMAAGCAAQADVRCEAQAGVVSETQAEIEAAMQADADVEAQFNAPLSLTREDVAAWRDGLVTQQGYAAASVNRMVAAVNAFLRFLGLDSLCVKALRVQRRPFRDPAKELTREEYERLLAAAQENPRLALLLETLAGIGIRVSESAYITVEAARTGRAEVVLKGKVRTILIPAKLCRKLLKFARKNKIASGAIFRTRSGRPLSRRQIWAEMKALCAKAGVERTKVFPHNLRHLFARMFYKATRDIAKLADVLGHSSIETTRIYLISTGAEHARVLEQLGLVT